MHAINASKIAWMVWFATCPPFSELRVLITPLFKQTKYWKEFSSPFKRLIRNKKANLRETSAAFIYAIVCWKYWFFAPYIFSHNYPRHGNSPSSRCYILFAFLLCYADCFIPWINNYIIMSCGAVIARIDKMQISGNWQSANSDFELIQFFIVGHGLNSGLSVADFTISWISSGRIMAVGWNK